MNTRPSELFSVKPSYVAWCFDRAVMTFGLSLENAAREASKDSKSQEDAERKAQRVIDAWLASADPADKRPKRQFADPFATGVVHRA